MPSKATYGSGLALMGLLVTQVLTGQWIDAGLAAIALGAGTWGYAQDRTVVGDLIRRFR